MPAKAGIQYSLSSLNIALGVLLDRPVKPGEDKAWPRGFVNRGTELSQGQKRP